MNKNKENFESNGFIKESVGIRILRIPEIGILIPIVVLVIIIISLDPSFLAPYNIGSLARATSFYGIITIGVSYALIAGQFDLSMGAVAGFGALISAILIVKIGLPVWIGLLVSLIGCGVLGLINGLLSVKVKIPSFLTTLGTMFAIRGLNIMISGIYGGHSIYPLTDELVKFGKSEPLMTSWSFIIYIIIAVISDFILRKTISGRKIYSTGANVFVARINGINTDIVKISTHVLVSCLAGISGILYMSRTEVANATIGTGWELPVLAGAIIGGISLFGGYGTVIGSFLGILFVQIIYNSMVLFNIRPEWQNIAIGLIMIAAAGFDMWRRTKKT
ncbi:MAG: ABC transporter permease [Actinobacteria bacterium]|nr:ABC transporter permease [Actinomycetota bacterium]